MKPLLSSCAFKTTDVFIRKGKQIPFSNYLLNCFVEKECYKDGKRCFVLGKNVTVSNALTNMLAKTR